MGLDTVETVLWAEKEFKIDIPDADAAEILTVGQFSSYIHQKLLLQKGFTAPSENKVFEEIKAFLVMQFDMKPEWITRDVEFIRDLGMG